MPQIILNSTIQDDVTRSNRQKALQKLSNTPVSNALILMLANWANIKGAEKVLFDNEELIESTLRSNL